MRLLKGSPMVQAAAYLGTKFGLDPVAVLTESDPWRYAVRMAAGEVLMDAEEHARKASQRG